jgi:hypothetical protein
VTATVELAQSMIEVSNRDAAACIIDGELFTSVYTGMKVVVDNVAARKQGQPEDRQRGWQR